MLTLGIDIGSLSTDAVLINEKKEILIYEVIATGASSKKACDKIFKHILNVAKLDAKDIDYTVATGYGRIKVPFANEVVTEITCHAKGVEYIPQCLKTATTPLFQCKGPNTCHCIKQVGFLIIWIGRKCIFKLLVCSKQAGICWIAMVK